MKDIIMDQTINYAIGLGHTTIVSEFLQNGYQIKEVDGIKYLVKDDHITAK